LKALEDSIANLDSQQSAAVVETYEGVQRIRGLAGSGKTIVLASRSHTPPRHPEWLIAVTFHTRSLKNSLNISSRLRLGASERRAGLGQGQNSECWGAPGGKDRSGIYYEFCRITVSSYSIFAARKRALALIASSKVRAMLLCNQ